jgi:hypothetical protein
MYTISFKNDEKITNLNKLISPRGQKEIKKPEDVKVFKAVEPFISKVPITNEDGDQRIDTELCLSPH